MPRTTPPAARFLSWGGGLDSTTVALLSQHGELPRLDGIIFADTQQEPAAVYETLEWVTAAIDIPVYRVSAGDLGADILAAGARHAAGEKLRAGHIGQPPFYVRNDPNKEYATADSGGILWRKCTKDYKIAPIRRKIRELIGVRSTGRLPQGYWVEQWIGFPMDELGRTVCSDVGWIVNTFPLILPLRMKKADCRRWLQAHGYPIPPKSSCIFCPYHNNAYWRDMRDHRPDEWQRAVQFDTTVRQNGLPGVRGQIYLHKSLVPLEQAPLEELDTNESLFCIACNT